MPTLTWTGKEDALRAASLVPFRLLDPHPAVDGGIVGDPEAAQDNLLIQGDNLEALKALLPYYGGRVKCIYIDPPYNTGSAFEHYDDNLEHSTWLSMMYPRLELLREFLAEEGSIWVSVDDDEGTYLRAILDEVFGRDKFVACNVWQKRYSRENREAIGDVHEYILVYATDPERFKASRNLVPFTDKQAKVYKNPNNDPKGKWRSVPMTAQAGHATPDQFYEITAPGGRKYRPSAGRCWGLAQATFQQYLSEGRIYFGKNGNSQPNIIRYLSEVPGAAPWTWWPSDEVGHTDEAKKEIIALFEKDNLFETPKPERLIQRILHIATNPGDLVLDSFLGSGTTAAVAQKMGRRWIGIEMGNHAATHCLPRLRQVLDGEQGGISESVGWKGGGGFRIMQLGETVFQPDGSLNPKVNFNALAAHIWWRETGTPMSTATKTPLLGTHDGDAYYLLYNGILGDKRPEAGNVLTPSLLSQLPKSDSQKVIFAEACMIPARNLERLGIIFKQIPYDLGGLHA